MLPPVPLPPEMLNVFVPGVVVNVAPDKAVIFPPDVVTPEPVSNITSPELTTDDAVIGPVISTVLPAPLVPSMTKPELDVHPITPVVSVVAAILGD